MRKDKLFILYENIEEAILAFDDEEDQLHLEYTEEWKKNGFPLSPELPFSGKITSINIKRYLENLFPEGENFEAILEDYRISKEHTFRILHLIGDETTGAFRFSTQNNHPRATQFRKIEKHELIERLDIKSMSSLVIWDQKPRLSVAGAQRKLPILILKNGIMGLGDGDLASTHILKFQNQNDKFPFLVLNEYFCMRLAKIIKLNVPEVTFLKLGPHPILCVKRFDRDLISDHQVKRSHIIDGCQALGLPRNYKYERNFGSGKDVAHIRDGASFQKLFKFCERCQVPAKATLLLLEWMCFNLMISNSDSHGKNISFSVNTNGIQIAPFYDLVNTSVYPKLEQDLAMAIGDEFNSQSIFSFQFKEFCDENQISTKLLSGLLRKMGQNILKNLDHPDLVPQETSKSELESIKMMKENIQTKSLHYIECSKELVRQN